MHCASTAFCSFLRRHCSFNTRKNPVLQKGRGYKLVLPPLFTDHSHGLPLRVSDNTQALVTCAATSQPTITSPQKERSCKLGVKLGDVFELRFRCASHQPAAFCIFRLTVLLPVKACVLLQLTLL